MQNQFLVKSILFFWYYSKQITVSTYLKYSPSVRLGLFYLHENILKYFDIFRIIDSGIGNF